MIPLRDTNPTQGTPVVNYAIIVICTLAFLYELALGHALEAFLFEYGLVPVRYSDIAVARHFSTLEQLLPFFTSMFLHGGWMHLIGNMWVLYIFGDNLESDMGRVKYLFFYIFCGLIAALIHLVTNYESRLPTVGASGAIAGVMGAYLVLYPRAKVLTLVPIFFFLQLIEVPAFVFLGLWFLLQFLSGAGSLAQQGADVGGVAWWAHIGGFIAGVVLLFFFRPLRRRLYH